MNKLFLSTFVVISFIAYGLYNHFGSDDEAHVVAPVSLASSPSSTSIPATPQPTAAGHYKNGTYTGSIADAFYGNVQVRVVISGGNITDVQFLDYPHDRRTSIDINSQAMPYLKSEAIAAQSSQVDVISGASQTSAAFVESLKSALSQAS